MARPRSISDEEILREVRGQLVRVGERALVPAVARALLVTQAALFKRFGTKQRLLRAAFGEPGQGEWEGSLTRHAELPRLEWALGCAAYDVFKYLDGEFYRLLMSGTGKPEAGADRPFKKAFAALVAYLKAEQRNGRIQTDDLAVPANLILGLVVQALSLNHELPSHEGLRPRATDTFLDAAIAIVARGLRSPRRQSRSKRGPQAGGP